MKLKMTSASVHIFFFILLIAGTILACKKDNNPTTPPVSNVNLKKGLLLYLPFDGNMADSSGNGNLTTPIAGAALTYDEHGNSARAFGGTGNGERILVTNNGSIKFDTAFTLSYEFMTRSLAQQSFVAMVNPTNVKAPSFVTGPVLDGGTYFAYSAIDSSIGCNNFGTSASIDIVSSFVAQPESWYNAICTYHKGFIELYINGKLIATTTSATSKKANLCLDAKIIVGGWWDSDPLSINGKLDEVRLYNRVVNADEIKELSKNFPNN